MQGLAAPDALQRTPQPQAGVTYAHKIDKAEAAIDWTQPAARIAAKIRAFDPAPGCNARLVSAPDVVLRLFEPSVIEPPARRPPAVEPSALGSSALGPSAFEPSDIGSRAAGPAAAAPGQVLSASGEGVVIASGSGWLRIGQLQRPGGRRLPAAAFLAGHPIGAGDRFQVS